VNKSLFKNTNPVEFPEEVWNKIKLFKPDLPINLKAHSFIIKDVVLKFISTKADQFNQLHSWFIIEDDIIHSKTFLEFQRCSIVIMKKKMF
jgi:hypothetical protein